MEPKAMAKQLRLPSSCGQRRTEVDGVQGEGGRGDEKENTNTNANTNTSTNTNTNTNSKANTNTFSVVGDGQKGTECRGRGTRRKI